MLNVPNSSARMRVGGRRWMLLFYLFAFSILAISVIYFFLSVGKPHFGVTLALTDRGWEVRDLDSNGLAARGGVKTGDLVAEINGQPADRFLERQKDNGLVIRALFDEMSFTGAEGRVESISLAGKSPSRESLSQRAAWFIVSVMFWTIGFYVLFRRPKNVASLLLCLSGLAFGLALTSEVASAAGLPLSLQLAVSAAIFGPWLLLHFFLALPEERTWAREDPRIYLIYLPATITLVLFFLIGYVDGQPVRWFRTFRLFEYGAGFLATLAVAAINYVNAGSLRTRQQMKIVLVACVAALDPFLVLTLFPSVILGRSILPSELGILLIGFIPLGVGYAMVTRKLMDIDIFIRRGLVYGLITALMSLILAAGIFFVLRFRGLLGPSEEVLIALALGGTATALFGPAKNFIETSVDKFFYRDRYDYRQTINILTTSLRGCKDYIETSRLIVGATLRTLNLTGACLFTRNQSSSFEISASQGTFASPRKQEHLETLVSLRNERIEFPNSASSADPEVAFLIPLAAGDKEVGILCLSQKATRQEFSSHDIYLLQGITSMAAVALLSAELARDVSLTDTFVSVASHELRSPLTAIIGYAELLQRPNLPETTRRRWLEHIINGGKRVSAMADEMLDVTRIHSRKLTFNLEKAHINDILMEPVSMIRENTAMHDFVIEVATGLPEVIVDRDKFGQVMVNLLSNAVKYSPGGGRITVSAQNDCANHRVILGVHDEGIGIAPEDRKTLFTTFHRIQRPETHGIRGSGLGLYIVKEWTEAMGGKVWVESELNKGSTFFVAVPAQNSYTSQDSA